MVVLWENSLLESDIANLKHLHAFSAIAKLGSITAACEQINISQPAMTQGIVKLERNLGVRLFDRQRGMRLTSAGEVYLQRIRRGTHMLMEAAALFEPYASNPNLYRLFTLGQLRALIAVVEAGNMKGGAQRLDVQPSTVHRACQSLGQLVNYDLFETTTNGRRPTRLAQRLYRQFKFALIEFQQARFDVLGWKGAFAGRFALGCMPLAQATMLPQALNRLTQEYPMLDVSVIDGSFAVLSRALQRGDIDMIIGALRDGLSRIGLLQQKLFDEPIFIVGRKGHPLVGQRDVGLDDLAQYAWVAPRIGAASRSMFDYFYDGLGRPDTQAHPIRAGAIGTIRGLLLGSDRLALVSAQQVHGELQSGLLAKIDFDLGGMRRSIGVTTRENWVPSVPQQRFLQHLQAVSLSDAATDHVLSEDGK